MATNKTTTHNGKEFTIEIMNAYDFVRDYEYLAVYVAIKKEMQRYDVGKATTEAQAEAKAIAFITRNF